MRCSAGFCKDRLLREHDTGAGGLNPSVTPYVRDRPQDGTKLPVPASPSGHPRGGQNISSCRCSHDDPVFSIKPYLQEKEEIFLVLIFRNVYNLSDYKTNDFK